MGRQLCCRPKNLAIVVRNPGPIAPVNTLGREPSVLTPCSPSRGESAYGRSHKTCPSVAELLVGSDRS